MRRRLNGEPLPYTWHGGRTPTERRNLAKLAEDTEPLDELVLGVGADDSQPEVFEVAS